MGFSPGPALAVEDRLNVEITERERRGPHTLVATSIGNFPVERNSRVHIYVLSRLEFQYSWVQICKQMMQREKFSV